MAQQTARASGSRPRRSVAAVPAIPNHQHAWLAALVESSFDAILSKNLDGTITSWNAAAERMYGYPAAEVIGRSIELIIPPDRLGELRDMDAQLARGERVAPLETVRLTRDGRRIDVDGSVRRDPAAVDHLGLGAPLTHLGDAQQRSVEVDRDAVSHCQVVQSRARPQGEGARGPLDPFGRELDARALAQLDPLGHASASHLCPFRIEADRRGRVLADQRNEELASEEQGAQTEEGGAQAQKGGATTLDVTSPEDGSLSFDPNGLEARAGEITLAYENPSAVPHSIAIESEGKQLAATQPFTNGKMELTERLQPGEYTFYCTVPGHREAGIGFCGDWCLEARAEAAWRSGTALGEELARTRAMPASGKIRESR